MANPHAKADALAAEFPFAKVVATREGDALLIGGTVFHVTGPEGNAALLVASAMRRFALGSGIGPVEGSIAGNYSQNVMAAGQQGIAMPRNAID